MKKIMKGLLLTAFVTLTMATLTGCGTSIKEKFEQWACKHEEVTETVTQATCEKDGELVLTCPKCGKEETKVLDKLGHEERVLTEAVAPTCTEKGHTKTTECSRCHKVLKEGEELPALGHNIETHAAQAATCTEIGWNAYKTCSRCDYTTYEEIPALGHDIVHHEAVAATCTEIGWSAYDTCSRCDHTTYEEIPALGHNIETHAAQAATCTEIGWNAYDTCSRCDHTTYEELPALGHTDADDNGLCDVCLVNINLDNMFAFFQNSENYTEQSVAVGEKVAGSFYRIYKEVGSDATFMGANAILFGWSNDRSLCFGIGAATGQTKVGAHDAYSTLVDSTFMYKAYEDYVDFYIPEGDYQIALGPYLAESVDPDGNGYIDRTIDSETTIGKIYGTDKCFRLVANEETQAESYSTDTNISTEETTNEEPSTFTVEVCLPQEEDSGVMFIESPDETEGWYTVVSETDETENSSYEDEWTGYY